MIERLIRRRLIRRVRQWNNEPAWTPALPPRQQADTSILSMFDSLRLAAEAADERIPF
jgi:hypothetical protein